MSKLNKIYTASARLDYEKYVKGCIKPEHHEEFLKVGSPHWLDFKAGWFACNFKNWGTNND